MHYCREPGIQALVFIWKLLCLKLKQSTGWKRQEDTFSKQLNMKKESVTMKRRCICVLLVVLVLASCMISGCGNLQDNQEVSSREKTRNQAAFIKESMADTKDAELMRAIEGIEQFRATIIDMRSDDINIRRFNNQPHA